MKIDINTVPPFYRSYVERVVHLDLLDALKHSGEATDALVKSIPEAKGEYRYADGKWSIKELLCHMMDAERIFAYRALRFARNDKTPLPAFEENEYATQSNAHGRTMLRLISEMKNLRVTSIDLFSSFTSVMLQRKGTASNQEISVLALGYVIAGHETHHRHIMEERYLR